MTQLDRIETEAKKAFVEVQKNSEYEFELSELAGYMACGIVENLYKQAFFAGYWKGKEEGKK